MQMMLDLKPFVPSFLRFFVLKKLAEALKR
jgi:hypothetical protein